MHIVTGGFEASIATSLHNQRLVATAKDVTEQFLPMVQANGIDAEEPTHPIHEVSVRRFHHEVKVVFHEAIRVHPPPGLLAPFSQSFDPAMAGLPINVIYEYVLLPISPIHDVVSCALILDSHRARHA